MRKRRRRFRHRPARKPHKSEWKNELDDLIRGACGGFLFGIPLIYTMEVWWVGSSVEPPLMLLALLITAIVVFLLIRTEGFRKVHSASLPHAAMDTVQTLALGMICAAAILVLLREITLQSSLEEALGKIVFESVPVSLGMTLANQFLKNPSDPGPMQQQQPEDNLHETLTDIGGTLIGATFVAFNIAPTDEVRMLSAAIDGPWLLAMIAASLIISYGIVFEANFANQAQRQQQRGIFQRPLSETVAAYLVSLVAAALMLAFFQQLGPSEPWSTWLTYTIILGLPATVGGAAGRLAV